MSLTRRRWIKRLGFGTLALVGLGAAVLPSTPASARAAFDLGLPTYLAPPPYYGYARPADYSSMPSVAGAMYIGFGGPNWH